MNPSNIVFTETMGSATSTSIAIHESNSRFDNDGFTMTGSAGTQVLTTSPSSSTQDYPLASGSANVALPTTSGAFFQITNINTSGLSNLELSFAILKENVNANGSDLVVEVSSDGTTFTPLTVASFPDGAGTNSWYYRIAGGAIPATANLTIRFRKTGTTSNYRIDDIRLIAAPTISSQPINLTKCVGQGATFSVTASGTGLMYQWRKDGNPISGATSSSYTISSVQNEDAASYDVIVGGACGPT
ncbi:MAG: hypothetical protein EOO89_14610, partial [Pedobacter sp.]